MRSELFQTALVYTWTRNEFSNNVSDLLASPYKRIHIFKYKTATQHLQPNAYRDHVFISHYRPTDAHILFYYHNFQYITCLRATPYPRPCSMQRFN